MALRPSEQGRAGGGVGATSAPTNSGATLVMGGEVGVGGAFPLKHPFGNGFSDPVTWSWIWFGVALAIVFGLPFAVRAGSFEVEL